VPKGEFCNHKINYIPAGASKISLDLLLVLLNCRISDWFFRLGSTNAAVTHYQIYNLPAPSFVEVCSCDLKEVASLVAGKEWVTLAKVLRRASANVGQMPNDVSQILATLSQTIQQIEARRELRKRSERSRLAPESQPIQDLIDEVLFHCYGLSEEEAQYVRTRLDEML
jgi:hypothetical protein